MPGIDSGMVRSGCLIVPSHKVQPSLRGLSVTFSSCLQCHLSQPAISHVVSSSFMCPGQLAPPQVGAQSGGRKHEHSSRLSPFFSSLGKKAAEHASYCPAVTNATVVIQYSTENQKERITPFHLPKDRFLREEF